MLSQVVSRYLILLTLLTSTYYGDAQKISGITVVSPPNPIEQTSIARLHKTNAKWVAFVPYGYQRLGSTDLRFDLDMQWWGESLKGIEQCIKLAKAEGMKIMLKPQVYVPGSWVGYIDFETEEEWTRWEKSYRTFITSFAEIAARQDVELLCIGTEYKISVQKREAFWRELISDLRKSYKGKLTYSSNWDAYQDIPFWDQLDYIGISAYFPLSDLKTPPVNLLKSKWRPIVKELRNFSHSHDRKILFTEYGYFSTDRCAHKAWELEKQVQQLDVNQKAQANAFDALYQSFANQAFWQGGFIWKWFPDGQGHEGYPSKDYTPQDKLSEETITRWYGKLNRRLED